MSAQFVETWIERYEVESSTGYSGEFADFDLADDKFQELTKAGEHVRFLAVIAES